MKLTVTRVVTLPSGTKIKMELPRKALSVRQPWATQIAWGWKTLEVRSWKTNYRGPLTIVSSARPDVPMKDLLYMESHSGVAYPLGVTIATVELVDIRLGCKADTKKTGGVDPTGQYVWVLKNPVHVLDNFPIKGRLGIFDLK